MNDTELLYFLNHVANFAMACIFTSHHIDMRFRLGPQPDNKQKTINDRTAILIDRYESVSDYGKHYPHQNILYQATKDKPDAELSSSSSDIDFDTVAVTYFEKSLYFACNFKVREMGTPTKINMKPNYRYFGFQHISIRNLIHEFKKEFCGEYLLPIEINNLYFISPNQPATNEIEEAAPHAEMQLLSHLQNKTGNFFMGVTFGVSKACCILCRKHLARSRIKFRLDPGNAKPKNWLGSWEITTKEVRVPFPMM